MGSPQDPYEQPYREQPYRQEPTSGPTPYPQGGPAPGYGPQDHPPGYLPVPGYGPQGGYPAPYGPYPQPYAQPGTNGMAIASMVLGILWLYWIGSVLALVFGYIARNQIKARRQQGDGMAVAGIVLGWIGVAALVGFIVIIAAFVHDTRCLDGSFSC